MFLDSLRNIPSTAHAGGKRHEISLAKGGWTAAIRGGDRHLARQKVARFTLIVRPRKFAHAATPGAPIEDTLGFQKVLIGLRHHFNFGTRHPKRYFRLVGASTSSVR